MGKETSMLLCRGGNIFQNLQIRSRCASFPRFLLFFHRCPMPKIGWWVKGGEVTEYIWNRNITSALTIKTWPQMWLILTRDAYLTCMQYQAQPDTGIWGYPAADIQFSSNPTNATTTFVQSTRMQRFLKNLQTLSCWYSLESSRWVLSDEYPIARVSIIFVFFASFCIGQISNQQHKG